jgi:HPt (histidine-containing phosphotransfer) domain-containing protein
MPEEELRAQLEKFQVEFRARLAQRIAALTHTIAHWQAHGGDFLLREAHESAHKLAGSGSTFGVPAVSVSARALEHLLAQAMAPGSTSGPELVSQIAAAMRALESAAPSPADAGSVDANSLPAV